MICTVPANVSQVGTQKQNRLICPNLGRILQNGCQPLFFYPKPGERKINMTAKRPIAYITAAWSGNHTADRERAAQYCRQVYEAGYSPICPSTMIMPSAQTPI